MKICQRDFWAKRRTIRQNDNWTTGAFTARLTLAWGSCQTATRPKFHSTNTGVKETPPNGFSMLTIQQLRDYKRSNYIDL